MISAFSKAFAQLAYGQILRVLMLSIILSIAVYALLIAGSLWALGQINIGALSWLEAAAD
jgi:uncharacterized metal-binding protein